MKLRLKHLNNSKSKQDDFIKQRKGNIGGSAIAAALRMHPYYLIQDLYLDLLNPSRLDEKTSNWRMQKGSALESTVLNKYIEEFPDAQVFTCDHQVTHPVYPKFTANFDGFSYRDGEKRVIEIKYISYDRPWNKEPGQFATRSDIPDYIWCQCQHYLDCTGLNFCDLYVMFDDGFNAEAVLYQIKRDDSFICRLRIAGLKMLKMVAEKTPPEPMTEDEVKALFPKPREKSISNSCESTLTLVHEFKKQREKFEAFKKQVRDRLASEIQDSELLQFGDTVLATRKLNKNGTAVLRIK